jgi:hypothetical protein
MPPSRPQNDQDKMLQGWIDDNNVEALSAFLVSNPDALESHFVFYYDSGYGWGAYMEYTLLQQAVRKDQLDVVKMLIEKGADPNYGGDAITPPIFYAVFNEPIFFFLLGNGARLDMKDAFGDTLQKVVRREKGLITKAVRETVLYGPKPKVRNNYAIVEPEENIFGEEMEDGTTVAFLDPAFRGQRIVAVRANGTPTNTWKKVLADKKNPWTRGPIDPAKVELQKVVVGPSVNLNGGKSRRSRRQSSRSRKNRTQRRRK